MGIGFLIDMDGFIDVKKLRNALYFTCYIYCLTPSAVRPRELHDLPLPIQAARMMATLYDGLAAEMLERMDDIVRTTDHPKAGSEDGLIELDDIPPEAIKVLRELLPALFGEKPKSPRLPEGFDRPSQAYSEGVSYD
jgi:hypothetical protein